MERCRLRALSFFWWPGFPSNICELIEHCTDCLKKSKVATEPITPSELLDYPWQKVGSALFELKRVTYLLVIDYFSHYPEVAKLSTSTSASVISALHKNISRHEIPEMLISDNGPQYDSADIKAFASSYGFQHHASSTYYQQCYGQAEQSVKTVKALLKNNVKPTVPCMALLSYIASPFSMVWTEPS